MLDGKHDLGCRTVQIDKQHPHTLAGQHLRKPDAGLPAQKAAVIANTDAPVRASLPDHAPGKGGSYPLNVIPGEALTDDSAPSAGSELNHCKPSLLWCRGCLYAGCTVLYIILLRCLLFLL